MAPPVKPRHTWRCNTGRCRSENQRTQRATIALAYKACERRDVRQSQESPQRRRVRQTLRSGVWVAAALGLHATVAITARRHVTSPPNDARVSSEQSPTSQPTPASNWQRQLVVWLEQEGEVASERVT